MNFSLAYEDYLATAIADNLGSVIFSPDGSVSISMDNCSNYQLNLTANDGHYTLPWHTIMISGTASTNATSKYNNDGIVLTSDNMDNVTVYGLNSSEIKELKFSTKENSVLITNDNADNLVIMIDTDNDGNYETPLNKLPSKIYAVIYSPGSGTGTMPSATATENTPFTLPDCTFIPPANKVFDKWAIGSTDSGITVETGNDYTFTDDTIVYALWKDAPITTYSLTVTSGTGGGSYEAGTQVSIVADTAPEGKEFDKWTTNNGGTFADVFSSSTTFTMPANDVTVTATYKDSITPPAPPVPGHRHNWVTAWSNDSTHHWHECDVSGCTITSNSNKRGYGTHVYDDDADTTCNTCDHVRTVTTPPTPPVTHTHVWAETWNSDGTYHWHECTADGCTVIDNSSKRGYGIHVYDDDTDTTCNICDYARIVMPPTPPAAHTHNWAKAWSNDGTYHWHECTVSGCTVTSNSGKGGYGTHVYDDEADTTCNACGYIRIVTPPVPEHTHSWAETWTDNATHHWHECGASDCTITDNNDKNGYGVHIYDDEADATCNTCGYIRAITPPTSEHTHNWAEAWTNNATHHWHECNASDCTIIDNNDKDGYNVHIYDDDSDTTCNTCGYTRTVTPPTPPRPVDREETYYINIPKTANGEIIPNTRYAESGDRVTLTAHPYAGYELESITVTNVRGREITLRDLGNDRYSFTMPNSRVSVEASFTKIVKNTPNVPVVDEPFTGLGTPGISGIVLNPAPMPFTDVHANNWFYNNVEYMWKHYLMSGVSDTQFAPDATTSRAMIWTVLARMNNVRTDVNPGSTWYERGMLWAMEQGVTDGTNPMDNITREQLATMLWRNAGGSGVSAGLSQFSDSSSVSDYALAAVRWAVANGILQGSDGKLNPKGSATRAQVAAMVMRYAERIGA